MIHVTYKEFKAEQAYAEAHDIRFVYSIVYGATPTGATEYYIEPIIGRREYDTRYYGEVGSLKYVKIPK